MPAPADRPVPDDMPTVATDLSEEAIVTIAAQLGRAIEALGGSVATAESCTGGLIARALTETAGSSAWFDRGVVTYSNASKQDLLGVSAASLDLHGAVSEVVAREWAWGALRLIDPERSGRPGMALAVTGIAGPGGAVPGKP
ncbi:MAG: CinA family protein, partial [Burkholderiales bacterium]